MKDDTAQVLSIGGREVRVTHPDKLYFSKQTKLSKLELVRYYVSVAPGVLTGIRDRPLVLKRFVDGAEGEAFYQKRAPVKRPAWLRTVTLSFPSGRKAEEVVVDDAAGLAWIVNLGCIELHPNPVRSGDLEHPDELRVDLDPGPGVNWRDVGRVALEVKSLLEEMGLRGWAKTSGSRGMHVNVRIQQRWAFDEVRRAALALSREVERRLPGLASSKWWKEERHGVFLDYNQNAKDRTVASAYSIRPTPDARVSAPLGWDEVPGAEPDAFTIDTVPERYAEIGDPSEGIDEAAGSLEPLLELAEQHESAGFGDAPWPPQYAKQEGEPARVQPSKRRRGTPQKEGIVPPPAPGKKTGPTGRRRTKAPLIEIARAQTQDEAMQGLERWKARHPTVSSYLEPADVMVDPMRGRSTTWTRIRVNLRNVPEAERPPQEPLEVDYDPWEGMDVEAWRRSER